MEITHLCNYVSCKQRADKMKMCKSCKLVRYCSIECQKKDWGIHKLLCKDINTAKESGITFNKKKYCRRFIKWDIFPEFHSRQAFNIINAENKMRHVLSLCHGIYSNISINVIEKRFSDALKLYLRSNKIEMKRNFRILLIQTSQQFIYTSRSNPNTLEYILSVVEMNYDEEGVAHYNNNIFITFPPSY